MSDIAGQKAIRTFVMLLLGFSSITFYICNARAADSRNDASYPSPAIQSEAQNPDSQEVPGGPLIFYATISTIVASFAALMVAVIAFAYIGRTNKKISQSQINPSAIGQQQKLTEAIDLISAVEYRLDGLEKRINNTLGQWDQYEARLNAAEVETEKAGRRLSQNYAAIQQATERMDAVMQDIEALKVFRDTIKAIRDRIVNAIGPSQTNGQQEPHPGIGGQSDETEEEPMAADEPKDHADEEGDSGDEASNDIMKYYYPGGAGS